jgi:hypothetical protein
MPRYPAEEDPRPVPPARPDAGDCCRSGCDPCIFDIYAKDLDRYRSTLRAWQERRNRDLDNE